MARRVRTAKAVLGLWARRCRTRATLGGAHPRILEDVGIGEADRRAECRKWFWQG